MFRKLVIALGLCSLLACGDIYTPPVASPVVINPAPIPAPTTTQPMPVPPPVGNFLVVHRGYYAGCRGPVVYIYNQWGMGNFYTINPLYCPFTNTVFYNVVLHWSMF